MMNNLPQQPDAESLCQLPKEELAKIVIEQASVIKQLQASIKELQQEIQRLRVSRELDSKTSSKPPSSDLLKKSEKKKSQS
jgi:transposase